MSHTPSQLAPLVASVFAPAWRYKFWRLLRSAASYREESIKSWEIYPQVTSNVPRAIYLDGQLQRVEACQEHTSKATEWERVSGGLRVHAATRAYRLGRSVLHDGFVYSGSMKLALESHCESYRLLSKAEAVENGVLACSLFGNRYFGHFFTDDLTLNFEASALGEAVCTAQPQTPHQSQYRQLFNVHATALKSACFETLVVLDDFGQNAGKRARYDRLRARLWALNGQSECPGVFFRRGKTGVARVLDNEDEIARLLHSLGFKVLRLEEMTATEIAMQVGGAKVVVGVEGSQLCHGVFAMHPEGTLVVLQPPYRFNNVYKDYTDCLGLSYAFLVGKRTEGGFEVSTDDVSRTLDLIA